VTGPASQEQLALFAADEYDASELPPPVCLDCAVDTIEVGEYYMLHDPVWLEANPDDDGLLCIGCVETRLGRRLQSGDFNDAPINAIVGAIGSARVRSRILGLKDGLAA